MHFVVLLINGQGPFGEARLISQFPPQEPGGHVPGPRPSERVSTAGAALKDPLPEPHPAPA